MKLALPAVLLLAAVAVAGPPDTLWTRTVGGRYDDEARWVETTPDGGCIVAGHDGNSFSHGLAVRFDAAGNELWRQSYWGDLYCVRQTRDSGFVFAGTIPCSRCSTAVYLLRTDSVGDVIWSRDYGPSGNWYSWATSVCQTADGGFAILGQQQAFAGGGEAILVIKTGPDGFPEWEKVFGGDAWSNDILQRGDGGYMVTGVRSRLEVILRLNSSGDSIGCTTCNYYPGRISPTSDGGCIVASNRSSGGTWSGGLLRLSPEDSIVWERLYLPNSWCYSAHEMPDRGFVLAGLSGDPRFGYDLLLLRADADGDTLWTITMGGDSDDVALCMCPTRDTSYYLAGFTDSRGAGNHDFWVLRFGHDTTGIAEPSPPECHAGRPRLGPTVVRGTLFDGRASAHVPCSPRFLFDASGRRAIELVPGANDVSRLASGVYFLVGEGSAGRGSERSCIGKVVIGR